MSISIYDKGLQIMMSFLNNEQLFLDLQKRDWLDT